MTISLRVPRRQPSVDVTIRIAEPLDARDIEGMQRHALRSLGRGFYSQEQIEAYLCHTPTLEGYLLEDRTYYVACRQDEIVGSGGWSLRVPAYHAVSNTPHVPDGSCAVRVRAMFVHPDFAGRGLGRRLLATIEQAIVDAGHDAAGVDATLSGIRLYERNGYETLREFHAGFPEGVRFPLVRMYKRLMHRGTQGGVR